MNYISLPLQSRPDINANEKLCYRTKTARSYAVKMLTFAFVDGKIVTQGTESVPIMQFDTE